MAQRRERMRWCLLGTVLIALSASCTRPDRVAPPASQRALVRTEGVPVAPPPAANARATFADAYGLVRAGQFQSARPLLESLRTYAPLQDYVLHYLALSCARTGEPAAALDLWTQLSTTQPLSIFSAQAALERGRIRRVQGDADAARADLIAARNAGDSGVARAARFELAELDAQEGASAAAYDELMALRRAAPGTAIGQKAKRRVDELRQLDPELRPAGSGLSEELDLLLAERNFAEAVLVADEVLADTAPSERPGVLRQRADAEYGSGQLEEALTTLDMIAEEYPDSSAAPGALFRAASLRWNRDRDAEAERGFVALRQRYPDSRFNADALYAIARIEQSSGRTDAALNDFAELVREYPDSNVVRDARWRIAWIHYQQGQWRSAAAAFDRLNGSGGATDDAAAQYWRARALEQAGDANTARQLYEELIDILPTSYYAYWASQRLSRPAAGGYVVAPEPSAVIGDPPPAATDGYHLERAQELLAAGLPSPARTELRAFEHANDGAPGLNDFLIPAYEAAGGYRDAIRVQSTTGTRDPTVLYPLAFWSLVSSHTAGTTLDPLLVLALMRQESLFDPEARSPADARGLMQLLPRTADEVAQRTARPEVATEELYDPQTNIDLGIAHFQELMALYDGNMFKALAAYNGGAQAVAKWDARYGDLEVDEFVENITYRETRDYVKKVTANYREYQRLYVE